MAKKKKANIKKRNRDSDGRLWKINEIYTHGAFCRQTQYLIMEIIDKSLSEYHSHKTELLNMLCKNPSDHLNPLYRTRLLESLAAFRSLEDYHTLPIYELEPADDDSLDVVPLIRAQGKRVCPWCNSNQMGCVHNRFWEIYTIWQRTSNNNWLHIRRCRREKKLFIAEHPSELIKLSKDGKRRCPQCDNKIDEISFPVRCDKCKTPLMEPSLLLDDNELNQKFGHKLETLKFNLQDILSKVKTVKFSYDLRPINGPLFTSGDFHEKWPEISCRLTDEENMKVQALITAPDIYYKLLNNITDKDEFKKSFPS